MSEWTTKPPVGSCHVMEPGNTRSWILDSSIYPPNTRSWSKGTLFCPVEPPPPLPKTAREELEDEFVLALAVHMNAETGDRWEELRPLGKAQNGRICAAIRRALREGVEGRP